MKIRKSKKPKEAIYEGGFPEQEPDSRPVKKRRRPGVTLFFLAVILAVGGSAAYYFAQRQQPVQAVEAYLSSVRQMDFSAMEAMLQSSDLTALDNADVRNEAYSEFFQSINSKMTFSIVRNEFHIQTGTAKVTARIRYIDGSEIYKQAVSEFLRQIVSSAFSGENLTEEDTQQRLAAILMEASGSVEEAYSETDIVYPLIKAGEQWKIIALDDETVRLMSANFKSVEDEIRQSLEASETQEDTSGDVTAGEAGGIIELTGERFTIRYSRHVTANDFAGEPCLLVYYDYTNTSSSPSSAMVDVSLQAYQNGEALSAAIPESNDQALDQYMTEIPSGETVSVCQAFSLNDMSEVTLQAGEAFSFGSGQSVSQILQLQ